MEEPTPARSVYIKVGNLVSVPQELPLQSKTLGTTLSWSLSEVIVVDKASIEFSVMLLPEDLLWISHSVMIREFNLRRMKTKANYLRWLLKQEPLRKHKSRDLWINFPNGLGCVSIQYYPHVTGILIKNVGLTLTDTEQHIMDMSHKLSCLVGGTKTQAGYLYLGRAQQISTNFDTGTRIYTWESLRRHSRPLTDMTSSDISAHLTEIKKLKISRDSTEQLSSLLSSRIGWVSKNAENSEIDNDGFTNGHLELPVQLDLSQNVSLKFYNFKFDPPRTLEITVPRGEFKSGSGRITKQFQGQTFTITLFYRQILLESIIFRVKDYQNSLNFTENIHVKTY